MDTLGNMMLFDFDYEDARKMLNQAYVAMMEANSVKGQARVMEHRAIL